MYNKTTKILLFTGLIASIILSFSMMEPAEAKNNTNTGYENLSSQIDSEISHFKTD